MGDLTKLETVLQQWRDSMRFHACIDALGVWHEVTDEKIVELAARLTQAGFVWVEIDRTSWFYKNCRRQRKNEAKICNECPFRETIESQEERL